MSDLVRDLTDGDAAVRLKAAKTLERFGEDEMTLAALRTLERAVSDPDEDVRRVARRILDRLDPAPAAPAAPPAPPVESTPPLAMTQPWPTEAAPSPDVTPVTAPAPVEVSGSPLPPPPASTAVPLAAADDIVGVWVNRSTGEDGRMEIDETVMNSDGSYRSVIRDEERNVLEVTEGTYAHGGGILVLTTPQGARRATVSWRNPDTVVLQVEGRSLIYSRGRGVHQRDGYSSPVPGPSASPAAAPASRPSTEEVTSVKLRTVHRGEDGSGVIAGDFPPGLAPAELLGAVLRSGESPFQGDPRLVGAATTPDGKQLQALLLGSASQGAISAVLWAFEESGRGRLYLSWRGAKSGWPVIPRGEEGELIPMSLPDGSGILKLPQGWRITGGQKGMVSAEGPGGGVDLGIWSPVWTPEASLQAAAATGVSAPLTAPYGDVGRALEAILPQLSALSQSLGQPATELDRILERVPAEWPNGIAEFVHYRWFRVTGGQREPILSLGLIVMMPNVDGTWTWYSSTVSSPEATFGRNLPLLLRIWTEWKVDDAVFKERLDRALASMNEAGRLMRESDDYRRTVMDKANRAWDEVIRGVQPTLDTRTGEVHPMDPAAVDRAVEYLNRQEGFPRWKILAPFEW